MKFIQNLTSGSILLPNGVDLIDWLEVSDEDAEQLKKYEGSLLSISETKPMELKVSKPSPIIEDTSVYEGETDLAKLLAPEPPEAPKPAVPENTPSESNPDESKSVKTSKKKNK